VAINIKDPATEGVVRELAAVTGSSITDAIRAAAEAALARATAERAAEMNRRRAAIAAIADAASALPDVDRRPVKVINDELLGGH
jgi:antitoxin VapB